MHWKVKAAIQNAISLLPGDLSYNVYFVVQRSVGRLATFDLVYGLHNGIRLLNLIGGVHRTVEAATVFEVGTGRRCSVPLAFWLAGAQQIITVDINSYLRPELVWADFNYLRTHPDKIRALFASHAHLALDSDRLEWLCKQPINNTADLLQATSIHYFSPTDARNTFFRQQCCDYHISVNVLEHIPPDALQAIMQEAHRLLKPDGLFVHQIDMSDHFSHTDRSISAINFLRFDDATWHRYAGNRYMYQNRLRSTDYLAMLENSGFTIKTTVAPINQQLLTML